MSSPTEELRATALAAWHRAAGAKLAPFAGWSMPLEYPAGTVSEHRAVRSGCGVFDVSHMGNLFVRGERSLAALNELLTNDLARLQPGGVQYTLLCDESGDVVDDMLATLIAPDEVMLVPNAANTVAVRAILAAALGPAAVRDASAETAILAVQGPASAGVVANLGLPAEHAYMTARMASYGSCDVIVSRTGYTGERGYELILPATHALEVWEELLDAREATPCGLGARDTLRTEMGYPLHGQDLGSGIGPVAAMLSWAVAWDKPAFRGRAALLAQRGADDVPRLRGLVVERGIPRPGMSVLASGRVVGRVTSGTFSPTLKQGIALALLERSVVPGDAVTVKIREREVAARVVKPPFVGSSPK